MPRPAVDLPAAELAPGLACDIYERDFRALPDFESLTPARSLVLPTVELPTDRPGGSFALRCQGFLSVPADGVHTLALRAFVAGLELLADAPDRPLESVPAERLFHHAKAGS